MKPNQAPNIKAWRIKEVGHDGAPPWSGPWYGETMKTGIESYLSYGYDNIGPREITVTKIEPQYSWETSPWQDIATYKVCFTVYLKNIRVNNYGNIYLKVFPYES